MTYSIYVLNEFIDFLETMWIFQLFFSILKNERNVKNFDMFLYQDFISHIRISWLIELSVPRL